MKKTVEFVFCLNLIISSLCAVDMDFLSKKEILYLKKHTVLSVYVEPDIYYYSYTYGNYVNGYAIEYLSIIAEKLDVRFDFISDISREEALKRVKLGTLDMALYPKFQEKNRDLVYSKYPIGILKPALLIPKIYQLPPNLDSVEDMKIAMVKRDGFLPIIKEKYPNLDIVLAQSTEEILDKLKKQEVDIAIGIDEVFTAYIEYKMTTDLAIKTLSNNSNFPSIKMNISTSKEREVLMSIMDKTMSTFSYKELDILKEQFFPSNTLRQTNITVPLSKNEQFFLMKKQFLKVCVFPKNLPYGDIAHNRYIGIGADMLSLLENRLDISMELIPSSSKQETIKKLLDKKCDFLSLSNSFINPKESLDYTTSLFEVPLVVVTANDYLFVDDFESISNLSFAILKNSPMITVLKEGYKDIKLFEISSEIEAVKMVEEEKYFGLITSKYRVSHIFRNHIADSLKISSQIPISIDFAFATLKENRVLFNILEKSMPVALENDTDKIIQKWVPKKYPKGFDYKIVLQLVVIFLVFSILAFMQHLKSTFVNQRLQENKDLLAKLNQNLEKRIKKEVAISREKDMLMYRQSRFASMGEMIGNIAHQWRQPLMELSALLMELQASIRFKADISKDDALHVIDNSNRVIKFMSHTINDFRNFFSPKKEFKEFCINEVVDEAINIMSSALQHHKIKIEVISKNKKAMAYGLRNEYAQVIVNLISNAKDMLISREITDGEITIIIDVSDDASQVSIIDNAGGIKNKNFIKIFEPFYTKGKTNGTGIGLFMSKMIIENNMKGQIVANNLEKGAVFLVTVPKGNTFSQIE